MRSLTNAPITRERMQKTVLITGGSSGIGLATVHYFASKGWDVVATMRNPEVKAAEFKGKKNVDLVRLDVLDRESIQSAVRHAQAKFGGIDVLVNNAGYAMKGVFEASTSEQIRRQIETNVLGLMDVTREVIPVMRKQGGGVIVNISSIGGRIAMPLYSIYQSTKFAVEGFSESLYYELRSQNIKVKLMEPGVIITDFYTRSMNRAESNGLRSYDELVKVASASEEKLKTKGSTPDVVAKRIFEAATDGRRRLRYHAGKYSTTMLILRKLLPDRVLMYLVGRVVSDK
jgi:NAD(P)-dependent dehydrogenase (short-subunit alcohol dehydrogenase family)